MRATVFIDQFSFVQQLAGFARHPAVSPPRKPTVQFYEAVAESLVAARRFVATRFPQPNSFIELDVALLTYYHWRTGLPLLTKQVHILLGSSEAGMRNHQKQLEQSVWCRFEQSNDDRRYFYVLPEKPLVNAIEDYLKIVAGHSRR